MAKIKATRETLDYALEAAQLANTEPTEALEIAELVMCAAGWCTNGIEHVAFDENDPDSPSFSYVNMGDTYASTIVYDEINGFAISSWGDVYEEMERAYCEENQVIRCGYCSQFTPHPDDTDWREVECESCGNKVGG